MATTQLVLVSLQLVTREVASHLLEESADTHTMTIYTEAKINWKMAPQLALESDPGKLGTAARSIFKMLRNAVPNSPGDRF